MWPTVQYLNAKTVFNAPLPSPVTAVAKLISEDDLQIVISIEQTQYLTL